MLRSPSHPLIDVATRLYIASDFHASDRAWRTFLGAIRLNVYKADIALFAGDLTGTTIVPVLESELGYEAELLGVKRSAVDDVELALLERDIADAGQYSFVTSSEEADRVSNDETARSDLRARLVSERVQAWMELATDRLASGKVPLYLIPGNDDEFGIDPILSREEYAPVNAEGRVLDLPGGLQLLACGWSNTTPWNTPREETEEQLFKRLDGLAAQVADARRAVFMIHVPPYDSGLDTAPLLDENLRPTIAAGDVLRGPVGSKAVRAIIDNHQPVLSVHGHIHEVAGERWIGETLAVNPGSEVARRILRGYLVDVGDAGIELVQRVEA